MDTQLVKEISENDFITLTNEISRAYNKDQISRGWYSYANRFYKAKKGKKWGNVVADEMHELTQLKKITGMLDMIIVGYSVIKNEAVLKEFLQSLPLTTRKVFEYLLWKKQADRPTIEDIAGISLLEDKPNERSRPQIKQEFALFHTQILSSSFYFYKDAALKIHVSIHPLIRKLVQPYFPQPFDYKLNPIKLPIDDTITFFNAEEVINQELPALITCYIQQRIKYSVKGKPNMAAMPVLQRNLQIKEFYSINSVNKLNAVRTILLSGLLHSYEVSNLRITTQDIIKHLFRFNFLQNPTLHYTLNFLKGLSSINIYDFKNDANKSIYLLLQQLPLQEWITIENLLAYIDIHFYEFPLLSDWDMTNYLFAEINKEPNKIEKKILESYNKDQLLTLPFIKGCLFLFASYGLIEICYKTMPPKGQYGVDYFSEYDGIVAIKLTSLGAYVFDLKKEYQPPANNIPANNIVFEENSLMVRVAGNLDLAHLMLMDFVQKVSDNRYVFSHSYFLKNCKKSIDIINKIALFRQSVAQKLPANWEVMFTNMVSNSTLVKGINNMCVFQIPADAKDLHKLLVQDAQLRQLIIKAEKYYVLIEENKESAFRARLKDFGILLE